MFGDLELSPELFPQYQPGKALSGADKGVACHKLLRFQRDELACRQGWKGYVVSQCT